MRAQDRFLVPGLVFNTGVTILSGDVGSGKKTFISRLAMATAAGALFNGQRLRSGVVLVLSSHHKAMIIKERINAAAEMEKIEIKDLALKVASVGPTTLDDYSPSEVAFSEVKIALSKIRKYYACKPDLLVIDGVTNMFAEGSFAPVEEIAKFVDLLAQSLSFATVMTLDEHVAVDGVNLRHIVRSANIVAAIENNEIAVTHSRVCEPTFRASFDFVTIERNDKFVPVLCFRRPPLPTVMTLRNPVAAGLLAGMKEDPAELAAKRAELARLDKAEFDAIEGGLSNPSKIH